ncbi:MAG: HAMP domain-containing histidine kinase [Oscillospiraceae bacterium]|jgi:signal transduction histidine kinase|nr:HAMP domain-containing histidine kinase [Oscillospiraceae bacterium]
MRSAFFKSFLASAIVIFLSFLMLGITFISVASGYVTQERRDQMDMAADMLADYSATYVYGSRLELNPNYHISIHLFSQSAGATILALSENGRVVACSDLYCSHTGRVVPSEVLRKIDAGQALGPMDLNSLFDDVRVSSGRVIRTPFGRTAGYVLVTAASLSHESLLSDFARIFVLAAMGVVLFAFLSAAWSSRRMTRPLKIMGRAAQSFAQGDFSIRVPTRNRSEEIDELAVAFNAMADALQKSDELRSEFIANVSHELKTPMTTISGFVNGILDGTIPEEKQKDYLRAIRGEVLRLSRLVSQMLDIARLQAGQTPAARAFDVTEVLRRVLLSFESAIEAKEMVVETEIPDEAVMVMSNQDAVTQVVYNLLDNAVKYGAASGVLGISLTKRGGRLHVTVYNEGPTIPPEDIPYVFERFHKADKSRGVDRASLGLGLYIVRTILSNMGEKISVTSEGGLTSFAFTLSEAKR